MYSQPSSRWIFIRVLHQANCETGTWLPWQHLYCQHRYTRQVCESRQSIRLHNTGWTFLSVRLQLKEPVLQTTKASALSLQVVDLKEDAIAGTVVWFSRSGSKVTEKNVENEISMGQIVGSAVDAFGALFSEVYLPILTSQEGWGQAPKSLVQNFLQVARLLPSWFFVFAIFQTILYSCILSAYNWPALHFPGKCWFICITLLSCSAATVESSAVEYSWSS